MNLMDNLPAQYHPEPEVIEPEIVGYEKKPSWWTRFKSRALLSLIIGIVGLILSAVGALLTISIIGAAIGGGIGAAVFRLPHLAQGRAVFHHPVIRQLTYEITLAAAFVGALLAL